MGWLEGAEIVGIVVVLAVALPVLGLLLRKRWLASRGAVVPVALRRMGERHWQLGVARYTGSQLWWYPSLSTALQPRHVFQQGMWLTQGQRLADEGETAAHLAGGTVTTLVGRGPERFEISMDPVSLTGLCSWLESAAPGVAHYGNTEE